MPREKVEKAFEQIKQGVRDIADASPMIALGRGMIKGGDMVMRAADAAKRRLGMSQPKAVREGPHITKKADAPPIRQTHRTTDIHLPGKRSKSGKR